MKFAICNEVFGAMPFTESFALVAEIGYTGIEIAPFTLAPENEVFDVRSVSAEKRAETRRQAEEAGLEITGLHWLLAKTEGLYLTSPDARVRVQTGGYLVALAELCAELGGKFMVLGSPGQRNLLPGVDHDDGMKYAAEVIAGAMPMFKQYGVTLALEALAPSEGDFLNTAALAHALADMVGHPNCQMMLDTKAMSSEEQPIPDIIREQRDRLVYFHANDPNLLGPGMGDVDFQPILQALRDINYGGWISVEPFRYEPTPEEVARQSYVNLLRAVPG